jgi:hypothetical protein
VTATSVMSVPATAMKLKRRLGVMRPFPGRTRARPGRTLDSAPQTATVLVESVSVEVFRLMRAIARTHLRLRVSAGIRPACPSR